MEKIAILLLKADLIAALNHRPLNRARQLSLSFTEITILPNCSLDSR